MVRQPIDWKLLAQRWDTVLGIVVSIAGAAIIWLSAKFPDEKDWIIGLGGAVLGAGVSIFAVAFATHTRERELDILLEGALPYGGFDTTEERLHPFRRKYHVYYVNDHPSKAPGGSSTKGWFYTMMNLKGYQSGKLRGRVKLGGHRYQVEGFLKKDSLLICRTNEDKVDQELVATFVLQDFANIYPQDFYGVLMTETLVGGRSVSACIVSTRPLLSRDAIDNELQEMSPLERYRTLHEGVLITGRQAQESLSQSWFQGMRAYGYMLFHLPGVHDEKFDAFGPLPDYGKPERRPGSP